MEPVIMITRDPDYENIIELFGVNARVIDVDLGSQFNGPKDFRALPDDEQQEWIDDQRTEFDGLPLDHPARASFESLVQSMKEA